ncbi:MAG: BamA/TamA family outer membrane protein [Myxococcota bacterium]|nr:BamA/TamA family outer membrane protein [Myxococcota bacterium]
MAHLLHGGAQGSCLGQVRLAALTLSLSLAGLAGFLPLALADEGRADGDVAASERRLEPGVLPAVSYDSDLGIGLGVIGNIALIDPAVQPYRWRLSGQAFVYLDPQTKGPPRIPFQSHYLRLDRPGLAEGKLRVRLELRFQRQSNAGYYGLGQGSVLEEPWLGLDEEEDAEAWVAARRFNEYDRIYPALQSEFRLTLPRSFFAFAGVGVTWNWVEAYSGSRLALDRGGAGGAWVKEQLVGLERHGTVEGSIGLAYDSRDNESAPLRGFFHELSLRGGALVEIPGGWGGANLTARFYAPFLGDRLSMAARVIADLTWGEVPFYELARYGGTESEEGPGGSMSLRGVPARRYHGKVKLIGNYELRSRFLHFDLRGQAASLGAVVFIDAGRVWADMRPRPELDSGGKPLAFGVGGGVRFQVGQTFIVRFDLGWSPGDLGIAFDIGHIF